MNTPPSKADIEAIMNSWPGKRGQDIPEDVFDQIAPVAHGIAKQVWGTGATPEQLQHLYDNQLLEPQQIKDAFNALPHPHAPSTTVGEFPAYSQALQLFKDHS